MPIGTKCMRRTGD
jgi:hypothetical protein